jgi:small subunit ribosomal protein S6
MESKRMNKEKQNLYEGMYVISASLSDDARKKAIEKLKSGIANQGGSIQKEHDLGRKRLAYEIEGHREGHYVLLYFKAPTQAIDALWKEYHLNEDLIRYMTLQVENVMEKLEFKPLVEVQ